VQGSAYVAYYVRNDTYCRACFYDLLLRGGARAYWTKHLCSSPADHDKSTYFENQKMLSTAIESQNRRPGTTVGLENSNFAGPAQVDKPAKRATLIQKRSASASNVLSSERRLSRSLADCRMHDYYSYCAFIPWVDGFNIPSQWPCWIRIRSSQICLGPNFRVDQWPLRSFPGGGDGCAGCGDRRADLGLSRSNFL